MKGKTLGEKLQERRESLKHSQLYLATKLDMTQPALSLIEKNKTKFSDKLRQRIKVFEGYEDFDLGVPEKVDSLNPLSIPINGRWVIDFLIVPIACIAVPVASIFYLNFIFASAEDAARGYGTVNGSGYPSMVFIFAFIFTVLNALAVYGIYRLIKWWRKRL